MDRPDDTLVIYNDTCPICAREIGHYRARTEAAGAAVRYAPIGSEDARAAGLSVDSAARRLHVIDGDGRRHAGLDAFLLLWAATPGYGWLARVMRLPGIYHAGRALYDRALAPLLYRMHLRRSRRR